jgi:hypothetical protein
LRPYRSPWAAPSGNAARKTQRACSFALYRWIEIGLLALGLALVALSARASWLQGLGAGLAVQAGLMVVLDFFAERRGDVYLDWLRGA